MALTALCKTASDEVAIAISLESALHSQAHLLVLFRLHWIICLQYKQRVVVMRRGLLLGSLLYESPLAS